jgi:hypothetical protein
VKWLTAKGEMTQYKFGIPGSGFLNPHSKITILQAEGCKSEMERHRGSMGGIAWFSFP